MATEERCIDCGAKIRKGDGRFRVDGGRCVKCQERRRALRDGEVFLEQGDLEAPGQWKGARRDGIRTANVSCPGCGKVASLSGHEIRPNGQVFPSLVCPFDGCGFHAWVTLKGWTPD